MRTSENARRMVVFFGKKNDDGKFSPGGTGFLVVHREQDFGFGYLVTAKHVALRLELNKNFFVQLNSANKTAQQIHVDDAQWAYHTDPSVDVAVAPFNLKPGEFDTAFYNLADTVRRDASPYRVQNGDRISIVGLFRLHAGSSKIVPIVHSGNIALLPDATEKIPIKERHAGTKIEIEAYLVEAQTLEGLSGAPVFQREAVSLRDYSEHNGGPVIAETGAQLLGVYTGAWDGDPGEVLTEDRSLGPKFRVPVGVGLVVPAEFIQDIIYNNAALKAERAAVLKKRDEQKASAATG